MSFVVIELRSPTDRATGLLQRRMLEVRAGLFVGTLPARIRDQVWGFLIDELAANASAIMIYPSPSTESGFLIRTFGADRREPTDLDGASLIAYRKHCALAPNKDPIIPN